MENVVLLGIFALMALALGGTYGVTSYLVSQRTREIGIRIGLGARTPDITRAVLGSSLFAVGVGTAAGLGGSIVAGGRIDDLLFGVPPYDPAVLALAVAALTILAVVANMVPARRAARLDPMRSLRAE